MANNNENKLKAPEFDENPIKVDIDPNHLGNLARRAKRNKEYAKAMCKSGTTVKDLYKMLCPVSVKNKQILEAVVPYDDGPELSKRPVKERMEILRQSFARSIHPVSTKVMNRTKRLKIKA